MNLSYSFRHGLPEEKQTYRHPTVPTSTALFHEPHKPQPYPIASHELHPRPPTRRRKIHINPRILKIIRIKLRWLPILSIRKWVPRDIHSIYGPHLNRRIDIGVIEVIIKSVL
jgi:hypothetical protein